MRPENAHQATLLRLLRDSGPTSRAELGEVVSLSRSKLAVELDRLAESGLTESAGLAASRGGRRSSVVQLSSALRFLGVDIGATSVDVAVTDGQLDVLDRVAEAVDVRDGPEVVLQVVLDLVGKVRAGGRPSSCTAPASASPARSASATACRSRRRSCRAGTASRSAAPSPAPRLRRPRRQRRQHHGARRDAPGRRAGRGRLPVHQDRTGVGCGIVVDGRVHRGVNGSAGDLGHIRVGDDGPVCACGNTGCLEAYFSGAALARDALSVARSQASPFLAERLAEVGTLTAADVSAAVGAGDPTAVDMVRAGGRHVGQLLAGLVSFFNPGAVVIGGEVAAGLGHPLLAEIRSVVYRRSLPLATGNLPIVLSEMGRDAGVVGAARLISDSVLCDA
jgi:predicted NBD/HSP70 family sugar kinase